MSSRNFRRRILREARTWIGTPYVHQASSKGHGTDCLGLVRGIWRKIYGHEPQIVPSYSRDWNECESKEQLLDAAKRWFVEIHQHDARSGDLVIFRWSRSSVAKHLGLLVDTNQFIHAYEKSGVVQTTLGSHWQKRIVGYFRFPEPTL